jgi:hypothetical protein
MRRLRRRRSSPDPALTARRPLARAGRAAAVATGAAIAVGTVAVPQASAAPAIRSPRVADVASTTLPGTSAATRSLVVYPPSDRPQPRRPVRAPVVVAVANGVVTVEVTGRDTGRRATSTG